MFSTQCGKLISRKSKNFPRLPFLLEAGKENQLFYKTYFKLCYEDKHLISIYDTDRAQKELMDAHIKYHIEFFRNGLNAILKMWLNTGCQETPEEMAAILQQEYHGR